MAMHLLAMVLVGGMAVGDVSGGSEAKLTVETRPSPVASSPSPLTGGSEAKLTAEKLPPPPTVIDSHLEKAARDFRIQTYRTFRENRKEYDRRQADGFAVQRAWTTAGSNVDDQPKLIDWFERATACSRTGAIAELPVAPKFIAMAPKKVDDQFTDADEDSADDGTPAKAEPHDARLHVKPAAAASTATERAPAKATATAPVRRSTISALPGELGAGVSRAIGDLTGKHPAP